MRDHQHLPDEDGSLCAPESKPPSFQHPGNPGDSSLRLEDPRWWQGTFDRFFLFGTDNLDTIVLDMHTVLLENALYYAFKSFLLRNTE